jgi:tryptophan halogenase
VLNGLGLLDQNVARAEMDRDPKLRRFAQETFNSLVKEYRAASAQALGHAEFLQAVQDMA